MKIYTRKILSNEIDRYVSIDIGFSSGGICIMTDNGIDLIKYKPETDYYISMGLPAYVEICERVVTGYLRNIETPYDSTALLIEMPVSIGKFSKGLALLVQRFVFDAEQLGFAKVMLIVPAAAKFFLGKKKITKSESVKFTRAIIDSSTNKPTFEGRYNNHISDAFLNLLRVERDKVLDVLGSNFPVREIKGTIKTEEF